MVNKAAACCRVAFVSSLDHPDRHQLCDVRRPQHQLSPPPAPAPSYYSPSSPSALAMVETEKNMAAAGITLPPAPKAAANYLPCQRSGNLLYLSGHLPLQADGSLMTGKIGGTTSSSSRDAAAGHHQSVEYGYQAARQVGLNLVATLQQELDGDLDRVEQIVKLLGIVQSADDFHEQHRVVNGCSDVLVEIFGPDRGRHARSAIGSNALPLNLVVEIEAIVRIKD